VDDESSRGGILAYLHVCLVDSSDNYGPGRRLRGIRGQRTRRRIPFRLDGKDKGARQLASQGPIDARNWAQLCQLGTCRKYRGALHDGTVGNGLHFHRHTLPSV